MVSCPRCGTSNSSDAVYCSNCGTSLAPQTRRQQVDYLNALSAGVVLIILAVTFLRYQVSVSMIVVYFESMIRLARYIKPPMALFDPAIFFFDIVGVWSVILSVLRIILQRNVRKAAGDFAGAIFSFFIAFILSNYASDMLSGRVVVAYLIVSIGLLIVINAIVAFVHRER